MPFDRELEFAQALAREAAAVAWRFQTEGVAVEAKADASPVTVADKEIERRLARAISERFPQDGILGEEGAASESRSGRRWILDPIDGTRDFIRGTPFWCHLLALEEEGEVRLGVAHVPALDLMCWATRGGGAFRNGSRIRVSGKTRLDEAFVSLNQLDRAGAMPYGGRLLEWAAGCWGFRALGGTVDALLLAQGSLDIWIEPRVAPWDLAAVQILVEESGGIFRCFAGERTIYGGNAWACTPGLEAEVRALLGLH
jgi:histidinol phosphatase-like enzyme (inositol monophosphatase family)